MEESKEVKNKVVETYAGDMAKVIEDNQDGLVRKIIHSEEQEEREKNNLSPQSKKNRLFMFLGLVFMLVSSATLAFLFLTRGAPTVPVATQFKPLVFTDASVFIETAGLKKDDIAKKVLDEAGKIPVKEGGVEGIYLTAGNAPVGLRQFMSLIEGGFTPGDKSLVDDAYLLGAVKNKNPGFFMLLKARSTADIFVPLRAWESRMFSDLYGFAGVELSADTRYLLTKSFEDGIVNNKNARILYDKEGRIVIMYIFADNNSVVITNTEEAAREIMLRLASGRVQK